MNLLRNLIVSSFLLCSAAFASAQGQAQTVVLGKLGQTVKSTAIYASANSRSRVFYRLKPYEYLVINDSKYASYYRVLMSNGWQGYIRRESVAKLPYDVTQQVSGSQPVAPAALTEVGTASRAAAAQYGTKFTGTPYKWGGNDPLKGIDCSAFVKFLYGKIGIDLPRTAAQQANVGKQITRLEDLQPGDRLYFWDKKRGKIGHTGLYLGNGYFVHSSSGKGGVSTDFLGAEKWRRILVAARR
jgi:cell wall-associated NlpC family hydrolase